MERILLVGGTMLVIGLALAGVVALVTSYGTNFEMWQDRLVAWVEGHL